MPSELGEIFERASRRFRAPDLTGVRATCRFETEEGGVWNVRIDDGTVDIEEGPGQATPSCAFRASDRDLARILRGEQNLMTAALQGLVAVTGDLAIAQQVGRLIGIAGGAKDKDRSPRS